MHSRYILMHISERVIRYCKTSYLIFHYKILHKHTHFKLNDLIQLCIYVPNIKSLLLLHETCNCWQSHRYLDKVDYNSKSVTVYLQELYVKHRIIHSITLVLYANKFRYVDKYKIKYNHQICDDMLQIGSSVCSS